MGLRRKRWWASLVLPFALLLAAGCGGGAARVEGNVTLDGEPVDGGTISFFAAAADKQHADKGHGPITNGHYAVNSPDLKPGNYRVEIFWNKKTGKTVNNPSDPGTTVEQSRQVIPPAYNTKTILTADLSSGSNKKDFELKTK